MEKLLRQSCGRVQKVQFPFQSLPFSSSPHSVWRPSATRLEGTVFCGPFCLGERRPSIPGTICLGRLSKPWRTCLQVILALCLPLLLYVSNKSTSSDYLQWSLLCFIRLRERGECSLWKGCTVIIGSNRLTFWKLKFWGSSIPFSAGREKSIIPFQRFLHIKGLSSKGVGIVWGVP